MVFLLTGGSGFLGETLAARLVGSGNKVILLQRKHPKKPLDRGCEVVLGDVTDMGTLKKIQVKLPKIDGIIHMAALVPKNTAEDDATQMIDVNINGTLNVLEVFGGGVKSIVYASTAEVYGLPDIDRSISEELSPNPLSYYGATKLAGEYISRVYARQHKANLAILRFTVLYGSGDKISRAIPNFIKKAITGEGLEVFGGEDLRDYLHVSDAVQALYLAATQTKNGVFNIGTGTGISIKDAATIIVHKTGSKSKIQILPRVKSQSNIVLNIEKSRSSLGFEPKYIFPDRLDEQIKWHRQQN